MVFQAGGDVEGVSAASTEFWTLAGQKDSVIPGCSIRPRRSELNPNQKETLVVFIIFQWSTISLCLCKLNTFWIKCFDSEKNPNSRLLLLLSWWIYLMLRWKHRLLVGYFCVWVWVVFDVCLMQVDEEEKSESNFCKYYLFSCDPSVMWRCKG